MSAALINALQTQVGCQPRAFDTPLRLDADHGQPRSGLIIAGHVELFFVALRDGEATGSRVHVATLPTGSLLPEVDEASALPGIGLLAVPAIETEWLTGTDLSWPKLAEQEALRPALAEALNPWVEALSQGLVKWIQPRPSMDVAIDAGQTVAVEANQRVRPRNQVAWLACHGDDGFLDIGDVAGAEGFMAGELAHPFPLAPGAWMMIGQSRPLRSQTTTEALASTELWQGLNALHQALFQLGIMNLRLADVDEHNRLKARFEATENTRRRAFAQLRAAVDVRIDDVPLLDEQSSLTAAFSWLGQQLGFAHQVPAELSQLSEEPVKALKMLARHNRIPLRDVTLGDRWWQKDFGPLIGFRSDNGSACVLQMNARGQAEIITDGLRERFDPNTTPVRGLAWQVIVPISDEPLTFRDLFRFGLSGRQADVWLTLCVGLLIGLLGLAVPLASGYLINQVIPDHEWRLLISIGLILTVLGVTGLVLNFISTLSYARIEGHLGLRLQAALMDRLLRLPARFFRDFTAGDLSERVGGIAMVQSLISYTSANAILAGLFSITSLFLLFAYDLQIALWASLAVAVYVAISAVLIQMQLQATRPLAQLQGEINGLVLQLVLGVSKIRLAAAEDRAFARWAEPFARSRAFQLRTQQVMAVRSTLNQIFGLIGLLIFVLVIGQPGEQIDLLAVGAFAAMLVAFQRFATGAAQFTDAIGQVLAVQPQLERMRPLMEATPETLSQRDDPGTLSGRVAMQRISFRYDPEGRLILDDVSIHANAGEMIALVGPSGSGKSTLMRLLLGFEQPETGAILLDDQPLERLDLTAVRRQMGVVMQNAQPMPGSLFENIVGVAGGNVEDAWLAAERVGLADDIRAMPMGMQTVLMEGSGSLSGGQIQRLMIARAIVKNPCILMLDEATSALDNRTQATVTESLDRLNVTRIVVAHRLSTIVNADRIYVLKDGRVVESGNYESLMAEGGVFAALARRQLA